MLALDYSSGHPSGAAIKAAGYDAVIRYVGTPGRPKNITAAEYADLIASGVAVALVYENTAGDALYGRLAGQASARTARADADAIGFPANRPIYFAVDFQVAPGQMPTVMDYLNGAADVLGFDQVGVYGFLLTISAAMNGGHARWFWQCGAYTALVHGSHLYQHNNDNTTVSGITCDVNDALATDFGQTPAPMTTEADDMTPEQDTMLRDIYEQLAGAGHRAPGGAFPGWLTMDGTARSLTAVDLLRETQRETNQRLQSRVPGSTYADTPAGYAANTDAFGYQLVQLVSTLAGRVDGLTAALTQVSQHGTVDLAAVTKAAEDGTKAALLSVQVTVGVSTPAANPNPKP